MKNYSVGDLFRVRELGKREDLLLITDTHDTELIHEEFPESKEFDGFFVKVENGDFIEVYGFYGIIPYLDKMCCKIQ